VGEVIITPLCPKCQSEEIRLVGDLWLYKCPDCGALLDATSVNEWNDSLRLVWLRSRHASYSKELPKSLLLKNGKVRTPEFAEFTWEKWP
jgi:tRNA(Ile2) C34 agmatinyltransferase TiaS